MSVCLLLQSFFYTIGAKLLAFWLLCCCVISCGGSTKMLTKTAGQADKWVGTWATAPQQVEPANMPPPPGLAHNTIRQLVRVSIGGTQLRLRFSNAFSADTVTLKRVGIAVPDAQGRINIGTQKLLKFKGQEAIAMGPFEEVYSDLLAFRVMPGSRLAITIYFGETAPTITGHPGSRTTSYILEGDQTARSDFSGAVTTDHWYVINGIEVRADPEAFAIAVLGNSITDGRGSGTNRQNRWTDILSGRLLNCPATRNVGILNLGIGGNCVLKGGLGPTALARFDRDVLSQAGVKYLLLLEGINDIGSVGTEAEAKAVVQDLIGAYALMIDKCHQRNIKVYGCTILPFGGSFYDQPIRRQARDQINHWIRTGGKFDGVIDFDAAMRQPNEPQKIAADLHDGDLLHPNEKGYQKMGAAVDLNLFR